MSLYLWDFRYGYLGISNGKFMCLALRKHSLSYTALFFFRAWSLSGNLYRTLGTIMRAKTACKSHTTFRCLRSFVHRAQV